ncbi:hypothetical protein [Streptomyces sp. NPDC047097]|uniref:hypothetical protein n=1 Tax=Streptomyces sp. NPDC047097 TaxID=3155260 RepID=UPI0033CA3E2B
MPKDRGHQGPSRHGGERQHGWSPDVDDQKQQDNPSAHRSFHTEEYAGTKDAPSPSEQEKKDSLQATEQKSGTQPGEQQASSGKEKDTGLHRTGRRGRSQRPSGSKDDTAYTGVDPKGPPEGDGAR